MHTIAEQYFEFRARLGTSLFALSRLAQDAGIGGARMPLLQNLITNLKEPFVFVVVGEVNSGKSTFLNALFGEEFSKAGVVPTTEKIFSFKYGEEHRVVALTDTLEEIHCPNDFLKDFNIVDTPGTNSIEDEHQQITERFVPMADLVIFVFSVTNPWGATTWEFLERVHKSWFKNVVFVLQQCDLRDDEEVKAIVEHMKVTSEEKLGRTFPIYPVSAKQAFLAKTSGVDREGLYDASGFRGLEGHIADAVTQGSQRVEKLRNIVRTARVVLDEVREKIGDAEGTLDTDRTLIGQLDRTVYEQRERTRGKFSPVLHGLDHRYVELSNEGGNFLRQQAGFGGLLKRAFARDETPQKLERRMIHRMVEESRATLGGAADIIEDDLGHLWKRLSGSLGAHFGEEADEILPKEQPNWMQQREGLNEKLEVAVKKFVTDLGVKDEFRKVLGRRRRITLGLSFLALAAVVGGGALMALGQLVVGAVPLAVGVVLFLAAALYSGHSLSAAEKRFREMVSESREPLRTRLMQTLDIQVNSYYADFLRYFEPLRKVCDNHRLKYEPTLKQYHGLRSAFDGFARQLVAAEHEALS